MTNCSYCPVCRDTKPVDCPGCAPIEESEDRDPGEYKFGCDES